MHMTAPLKCYKHSNKPTNFNPLPVLLLKWLCRHICSACGDIVVAWSPSLSFVQQQHQTACAHMHTCTNWHESIWTLESGREIGFDWCYAVVISDARGAWHCGGENAPYVVRKFQSCVHAQGKLIDLVTVGVLYFCRLSYRLYLFSTCVPLGCSETADKTLGLHKPNGSCHPAQTTQEQNKG